MIEKGEPKVEQPEREEQLSYVSLRDNDATEVYVLGTKKKYRIRWLKNGQIEKLSRLILRKRKVDAPIISGATEEGAGGLADGEIWKDVIEDCKLCSKAAAVILLDGWWKLKLRYWFLWRWFYYVRQYDNIQLKGIIEEGKKKVQRMEFLSITTSLIEVRDTLMTMRTEEAEAILQELALVRREQQEKSGQS